MSQHDDDHPPEDNHKVEKEGSIQVSSVNHNLINATVNRETQSPHQIKNNSNKENRTTEPAVVVHHHGNPSSLSSLPSSSAFDRPCRVIIENPIDYHHEVIESVVNRYPLPWHKFNCSSTKYPIIYDFSLFQNRFPDRIPFYIGKKPKHLNQTEFWGWKNYFEQNLQYRNITRSERKSGNTTITTVAYYRNLVSNDEYRRPGIMEADAVIDVSCGIDMTFIDALKEQKNRYCVLHNEVLGLEETVKDKTCWVSPMYPPDHCTFLPIDLPKVESKTVCYDDDSSNNNGNKHDSQMKQKSGCISSSSTTTGNYNHNHNGTQTIRVCAVGGGGRDHSKTIRMFFKVPYREHNVTLIFSARRIKKKAKRLVSQLGLDGYVQFTYVKDFMEFAKFVSSCHVYLPCTDPKERQSHFPWGTKHLTGSIPQIIAYNLSSVMHTDLEAIYHDYLTAPVEVYNDETGSDAEALKRMIWRIALDGTSTNSHNGLPRNNS
jgi:hypothetical protein